MRPMGQSTRPRDRLDINHDCLPGSQNHDEVNSLLVSEREIRVEAQSIQGGNRVELGRQIITDERTNC